MSFNEGVFCDASLMNFIAEYTDVLPTELPPIIPELALFDGKAGIEPASPAG